MKSILRKGVYKFLSNEHVLGYLRGKRLRGKIIVLMYHELARDEDDVEAWTVVKRSDFISQMSYLLKHYDILSLEDALTYVNEKTSGPDTRPKAVITFDDGYAGNGDLLKPIIEKMKIPVTVFVATMAVQDRILYWYDRLISSMQTGKSVDLDLSKLSLGNYTLNRTRGAANWAEMERLLSAIKAMDLEAGRDAVEEIIEMLDKHQSGRSYKFSYLTIEGLKELAKSPLVTIGAHSHCHTLLTQLDKPELDKTIRDSKLLLERWLERPVKYFAYPSGRYNNSVIESVRDAGFECGLTTVSGVWAEHQPPFSIPRIGVGRYDSIECFKVKIAGGLRFSEGPF